MIQIPELKEFTPCRKCVKNNGYIEKDPITHSLEECECHIEWRKNYELIGKMQKAGIDISYVKYDIHSDYVPDPSEYYTDKVVQNVEKYIEQFKVNSKIQGSFLYFTGLNGTQKTSVANYIGRRLIEEKFSVSFLLMNRLIRILMKAEQSEDALKQIEYLEGQDLLIIDEAFDPLKLNIYKSKYQLPFLDTFLRERLNSHKGVLFISNVDIKEIDQDIFGVSISDFLERKILLEKTRLYFTSKYIDVVGKIDPAEGLFD